MMNAHPTMLSGIAAHVNKEWGYEGYRITEIRYVGTRNSVHLVTVRCSDGGSFQFAADQWGTYRDIPEGATEGMAIDLALEMSLA